MRIVRKEIEIKDDIYTGPIVGLVAVRVENGRVYAYFELDESMKNTKVGIKFVQTDKDYPAKDFVGYKYFDIINLHDNSLFGSTALCGLCGGNEYHIYVNLEHDIDGFIKQLIADAKNDPVPEGAELFTKAQVANGKEATFTAKNCLINLEVLNKIL